MKKAFSITVEQELYNYIKASATADSRTISSYIEKLIRADKNKQKNKQ